MVLVKTLTFFSLGYARAPWADVHQQRRELTTRILEMQPPAGGWGYEFDVQTRWSYYRAGTPNAVVTGFAVEALRSSGVPVSQYAAAADFILSSLTHPQGFFRYVPHSDEFIVNGSLLAARAVQRVYPDHPAVRACVDLVLGAQRDDGLWPYGSAARLAWVDNYHTAYTLLCLHDLREVHVAVAGSVSHGVAVWLERCFTPAGAPRFFADAQGPTDVNNVATALYALCRLRGAYPDCSPYVVPTLRALLALQHSPGRFSVDPRAAVYPRWNQGPAFWALAELLVETSPGPAPELRAPS